MTTQLNVYDYAESIQYQLTNIVTPTPVYQNMNRNYAREPKFITWSLMSSYQEVYTGQNQGNKGIDRPVFQISVFAQNVADAFNLENTILQSLNGYSGNFGNMASRGFWIAKASVMVLNNSYDDELGLHQAFLTCTLDVPA